MDKLKKTTYVLSHEIGGMIRKLSAVFIFANQQGSPLSYKFAALDV